METIEALKALERGETLEQEIVARLRQDGLVDVADVTNLESSGREFIFAGLTDAGLRLLKESKLALVSDTEREILRTVVRAFLDRREATSQRALLKQFKSPVTAALQRLGNCSLLQVHNNTYPNETYLPRASAFYHCGDSRALAFARKSTETVLRVLRDLFDQELDGDNHEQKLFTLDEVEQRAQASGSPIESNMVFTGLYLAQEFSVFTTLQRDGKGLGILSFSLSERIYDSGNLDWDKHLRQSNVSLVHAWQSAHRHVPLLATPSNPEMLETGLLPGRVPGRKVFLVHGHAEEPQQAVSAFLRAIDLDVIILHEQPNQGRTIIEKFEQHSDVAFAVVLLTPDDVAASAAEPERQHRRARQNVILELGYFMAKLGRNRVCCLYAEGVELPSDYNGVLYVPYDAKRAWKSKLAKELSAAGVEVDPAKLRAIRDWENAAEMLSGMNRLPRATKKEA